MDIESTLTRNQYIKLLLIMTIRRSTFYFVMAAFFVFLILALLTGDKVPFIIAFGYLALMILVYTISILHMGLSKKNKNFFLKKQFNFNDENVAVKTPISEDVVKWEAFVNSRKMAGYYLLYYSSTTFLVIPKSDILATEIKDF